MSLHDQVICGDALAVLKDLPTGCADALVSDPPAGVSFMQKDWDGPKGGRDQWIAWLAGIMAEARRCVRPGGYALVWALPRTAHWTAMALEDSGWAIRDSCHHIFSTGFPKSRSCLKPAHETWWLAKAPGPLQPLHIDACRVGTEPAFVDRLGQKAAGGLLNTVTGHRLTSGGPGRWPPNTLLSHVGGPDGCRPAGVRRVKGITGGTHGIDRHIYGGGNGLRQVNGGPVVDYADADGYETVDAWSCVEGCPVAALDAQAGPRTSGARRGGIPHRNGTFQTGFSVDPSCAASTGSASRFFKVFPPETPDPEDAVPFRYEPKASRRDRGEGNNHSTVKPTALMAWLCKLVTPPSGVVLDCFAGSGSTLVACVREGFGFIGIEQDSHYCDIARRRIAHAQQQRHGPLFANADAEKDA